MSKWFSGTPASEGLYRTRDVDSTQREWWFQYWTGYQWGREGTSVPDAIRNQHYRGETQEKLWTHIRRKDKE